MEQRSPASSRRVTEEEYLRLEALSATRHEFRNGWIVDMAGGTGEHSKIAMQFGGSLLRRLEGKKCDVFGSDLRVRINELGDYCYPDLSVACEPILYFPAEKRNALVNPRLLVEVTSPSSENEDRGSKFTDYRLIASLEEYVLVSQVKYQVETFYRQPDGIWAFGPSAHGLDKSIKLRSLGFEVPLAEIYAGIMLPSVPPKSEPT